MRGPVWQAAFLCTGLALVALPSCSSDEPAASGQGPSAGSGGDTATGGQTASGGQAASGGGAASAGQAGSTGGLPGKCGAAEKLFGDTGCAEASPSECASCYTDCTGSCGPVCRELCPPGEQGCLDRCDVDNEFCEDQCKLDCRSKEPACTAQVAACKQLVSELSVCRKCGDLETQLKVQGCSGAVAIACNDCVTACDGACATDAGQCEDGCLGASDESSCINQCTFAQIQCSANCPFSCELDPACAKASAACVAVTKKFPGCPVKLDAASWGP